MVQVLNISNGDVLNGKLSAKGNLIDSWLQAKASPAAIVEELYLTALARYPTARERATFEKVFI